MAVDEALAKGILRALLPGDYRIDYTDSTHCAEGKWTSLLTVTTDSGQNLIGSEDAQAFYRLRLEPEIAAANKVIGDKERRVLLDAVTQCLVRANILRPEMTDEAFRDVFRLSRGRAVVLVPDTNALSTGTLHWLLEALADTQVWLLPIVVSLIQVQSRDAMLKACVNKREPKLLPKALRSRQLINATLTLLERHRERYQVLEVDPQLLRYVRPAGGASADPDESDVLEDRLLMEAIHGALRSTRSRAEKRVVTSDLLLARMLRTEGLPNLFLQTPRIPDGEFPCLRYEPLAKSFVGSSLIHLMWELAHTFSNIRITSNDKPLVQLNAYWAAKTANDWAHERVVVTWEDAAITSEARIELPETDESGLDETSEDRQREGFSIVPHESAPRDTAAVSTSPRFFSKAPLPEVAYPQIIRLALAAARGNAPFAKLLDAISDEQRPSVDIARSAIEVLLRSALVTRDGDIVRPTDLLAELIAALAKSDLDGASRIFLRYAPYNAAFDLIREREIVSTADSAKLLAERLALKPSREGNERLWRMLVYLGQAWTDGDSLRDGTGRLALDTLRDALLATFNELQQDGLCSLRDVIPALCRKLRMSPWCVQQGIRDLLAADRLPEVSFQPSAGKRLNARDQILVVGPSADIVIISVPIDRIDIGDRPVFAIARGVGQ